MTGKGVLHITGNGYGRLIWGLGLPCRHKSEQDDKEHDRHETAHNVAGDPFVEHYGAAIIPGGLALGYLQDPLPLMLNG